MNVAMLLALTVGIGLITAATTGVVVHHLRRRNILDHPNPRSSHTQPTPRGGGLAVVPVIVVVWGALPLLQGGPLAVSATAAAVAALGLAAVSWLDDVRGLGPAIRFGAQAIAVIAVLTAGGVTTLSGGEPWTVAFIVLAWLWFINLFNFMDGIDGLAGVETVTIGGGVALVAAAAGLDTIFIVFGLTAASAAIGFLRWNWQPAKIFLGDVGSIPLGLLMGWLLLALANDGQVIPAIILPLYYLADATLTLGRRMVRGEVPWQAHKSHFYQRAVASGLSHAHVVRHVMAANAVLVLLAGIAVDCRADLALAAASIVVMALLTYLGSRRGPPPASAERSA